VGFLCAAQKNDSPPAGLSGFWEEVSTHAFQPRRCGSPYELIKLLVPDLFFAKFIVEAPTDLSVMKFTEEGRYNYFGDWLMHDAFGSVRISAVDRKYNNLPENKNAEINAGGFVDRLIESHSGVLLLIVLLE
jgi:hypothetical protein